VSQGAHPRAPSQSEVWETLWRTWSWLASCSCTLSVEAPLTVGFTSPHSSFTPKLVLTRPFMQTRFGQTTLRSMVTVLGAGVIGLTTAHTLEEAGFDVQVIAAKSGDSITSAAAGAIWLPFRADPPEHVNRWAHQTRVWESELARSAPQAGVDVLTVRVYTTTGQRPWWSDAVNDLGEAITSDPAAPFIWEFAAPRVVPSLFCNYLIKLLRRPIRYQRFDYLKDVPGDLIINCTGLGARHLTGDTTIHGVWGQTLITKPDGLDMTISISDERDPTDFFYSIPRRDEMVLGGVAIPTQDDVAAPPTMQLREAILKRARDHGVMVTQEHVLRDSTGLRPYRPVVRVEPDPDFSKQNPGRRLIHNYGHGGSGYTLCRGCALDVLDLVRA
jgi:D-amino-acid oxidase